MQKIKADFDVMINGGETYYGTIRGMVDCSWTMIDGELVNVLTDKDITKAVLKKFPTLEGREWNVEFNNRQSYGNKGFHGEVQPSHGRQDEVLKKDRHPIYNYLKHPKRN